MTAAPDTRAAGAALLAGYDRSLPQVYGYLVARCHVPAVAEDLASETYLAAIDAIEKGTLREPTTAWLIGVARHKLVDHWRRLAREERRLTAVADLVEVVDDPWDVRLEAGHARHVLAGLGAHHRSALVLRYLDGLSVPEVAATLGRTVHATEALLVRARRAFRAAYEPDDAVEADRSTDDPEGGAR
ncbi:RNA polymerase sigma factor [Aquihabitans sp. G128]|uniref:RNA polymerase sigma factor n=1 Tax=Aquihabitans sp. G128 TaxID=2849779 RepID=UPI001C220023|nr:RNA polymerase sigma factor [Aquihabitans sp. G128]QXC60941.1 RNA polymerase sigma factor [Aquihabitans sp. G128]